MMKGSLVLEHNLSPGGVQNSFLIQREIYYYDRILEWIRILTLFLWEIIFSNNFFKRVLPQKFDIVFKFKYFLFWENSAILLVLFETYFQI